MPGVFHPDGKHTCATGTERLSRALVSPASRVNTHNKKTRNCLATIPRFSRCNSGPTARQPCGSVFAVCMSLQLTHRFQIQFASISVKFHTEVCRSISGFTHRIFIRQNSFLQAFSFAFTVLKHCKQHLCTNTKPTSRITRFATFPVRLFVARKPVPKLLFRYVQ